MMRNFLFFKSNCDLAALIEDEGTESTMVKTKPVKRHPDAQPRQ
jgi:hypothetical protein